MKTLHLTIMIFCHVLLASIVLYFTTYATASPLSGQSPPKPEAPTLNLKSDPGVLLSSPRQLAESKLDNKRSESNPVAKSASVAEKQPVVVVPNQQVSSKEFDSDYLAKKLSVEQAPVAKFEFKNEQPAKAADKPLDSMPVDNKPVDVVPQLTERKLPEKNALIQQQSPPIVLDAVVKKESDGLKVEAEPSLTPKMVHPSKPEKESIETRDIETPKKMTASSDSLAAGKLPIAMPFVSKDVSPKEQKMSNEVGGRMAEPVVANEVDAKVEPKVESVVKKPDQSVPVVDSVSQPTDKKHEQRRPTVAPVVKGGLGPLHLLAATLCNYQPEKPVADETLNELYRRRAMVRKSLFEFMSLKFTNLEKLSSRLGDFGGLAVMPMKTVDQSKSSIVPSHGWPLVGKCTAHDLRLMGEAAWCDVEANPSSSSGSLSGIVVVAGEDQFKKVNSPPVVVPRIGGARAMAEQQQQLPEQQQSVDQSAVISKILRVGDVRDSQTIESSIGNLNLTQQQLASIQAQAASTRECRRNALRYTKAIFNHLAEDQRNVSESWPKLYSLISDDECARKRMIDIITALSGFRSDTTSVRRDNLEFAFAMDDLRGKVLENEINVPLTFDKQFIEVEQFLQQSVQLMLANIDPERAKITSARYRSLMSGPTTPDDQCIELHQRLMARNYPTDCNPTQFGQLPDVLRMTAHSLELWSIEKELSQRSAKLAEFANYQQQQQTVSGNRSQQQTQPQALVNPVLPQQAVVNKETVDECIASLVTS